MIDLCFADIHACAARKLLQNMAMVPGMMLGFRVKTAPFPGPRQRAQVLCGMHKRSSTHRRTMTEQALSLRWWQTWWIREYNDNCGGGCML